MKQRKWKNTDFRYLKKEIMFCHSIKFWDKSKALDLFSMHVLEKLNLLWKTPLYLNSKNLKNHWNLPFKSAICQNK